MIFSVFREWIGSPDRLVFLLPLTVFTILRLIPDHFVGPGSLVSSGSTIDATLVNIRQRELALVDELVRKHVSLMDAEYLDGQGICSYVFYEMKNTWLYLVVEISATVWCDNVKVLLKRQVKKEGEQF